MQIAAFATMHYFPILNSVWNHEITFGWTSSISILNKEKKKEYIYKEIVGYFFLISVFLVYFYIKYIKYTPQSQSQEK